MNPSAVDIDTYFDTLDFDVYDLDITASLIKTHASERRFQLPVPSYEPAYPEIKQSLSQIALEQATYEVRLLARQLENSPFCVINPLQDNDFSSPPPPLGHWTVIRRLSLSVGVLLIGLSAYAYYSPCSAAMSCFDAAKRQMGGLLSDRPHPTETSSTPASKANPSTQAIAPATNSGTPDPFREAVNQAMQAAELTQTASSVTDWETVVNTWLEAIRLMNITPSTNPRYRTAAVKVEEYANNLAYAQRRMREAAKAIETADTLSSQ